MIKPYNSLEAQGNAILQVCQTQLCFSFGFPRVQRALDASYHAQFIACLAIKQEIKKTKAALLDDTYFCHCHLNIKKALIITNK